MTYYSWSEKKAIFQNELIHSSCLMPPFLVICLVFIVLSVLLLAVSVIPQAFTGFLLAMLLAHGNFMKLVIEHLYPTSIGRWVHFKLLGESSNSMRIKQQHSRTVEHRVEVIPGILYIHMISQLVDNICYLIVYQDYSKPKMQGIVIDCGDAKALLHMIERIHRQHYHDHPAIEVTSVLCTHKHHDHTAGNRQILKAFPDVKIYGGAVERVPFANEMVKHDAILTLSLPANASIRAIAVPCHTRGSLMYQLTTKGSNATYLFSGDTVFSGGGGEAFEAHYNIMTSISRCFAEVLASVSDPNRCMLFPGHEYSRELLSMQFLLNNDSKVPAKLKNWTDFTPHDFFGTAGQYLVATHRRGLPPGKRILTIPSSLHHEIVINPQFRTLRKAGENLLHALHLWFQNRRGTAEAYTTSAGGLTNPQEVQSTPSTTPSSALSWNLGQTHVNHNVFTTFYSADLDALIEGLESSTVSVEQAAMHLQLMSDKMKMSLTPKSYSVTNIGDENDDNLGDAKRRPSFSNNAKLMKDAISAFVILGSPPTALTVSDSKKMGLPRPYLGKLTANDHLVISRSRLLKVMEALNLVPDPRLRQIINAFFDDAFETKGFDRSKVSEQTSAPESVRIMNEDPKVYEACLESPSEKCLPDDAIELGYLKFTLFGQLLPAGRSSWWSFLCKPCGNNKEGNDEIDDAEIIRKGQEAVGKGTCKSKITPLIYHDMSRCFMCKDSLACPNGWNAATHVSRNDPPPVEEGIEMGAETGKSNVV